PDSATPRTYTLSLHDALPIYPEVRVDAVQLIDRLVRVFAGTDLFHEDLDLFAHLHTATGDHLARRVMVNVEEAAPVQPFQFMKTDRKSTRLNSSHVKISYAVF